MKKSSEISATLYLDHFRLKEAPFKITPMKGYFYGGGRRGEILHALLYAINVGEGIMMVSGEVGSGKTMLLRTLADSLPEKVDIIYIANPSLSGREILYNICEELGLHTDTNRPDTVRLLQNHLIERHREGHRVVALIDEAQAMPDESLEEIRLLSNLETSRDKLLQILLFGQPELEEKLDQQKMRQLRERITVALKLKPFSHGDVREYISTRLRAAGHDGVRIFSEDACRLIANISRGICRRINVLADKAMLSAYERSSMTIEKVDVKRAIRDVNFGRVQYRSEQSRRVSRAAVIGVVVGFAVLLSLGLGWHYYGGLPLNVERLYPDISESKQTSPSLTVSSVTTAPVLSQRMESPTLEAIPFSPVIAENTVEAPEEAAVAETVMMESADMSETVTMESADMSETVRVTVVEMKTETIVETQPVTQRITVFQTVAAPQPSTNSIANDRRGMFRAIADSQTGEALVGEQLAQEIALHAEQHDSAPQTRGGAAKWQDAVRPKSKIADNVRWNWMPANSYLRSRLNATQTYFSQEKLDDAHTARLLTVSQERAIFLEKFLRYFADFYPIRNVLVYPVNLSGEDQFVVSFGVYSNLHDTEVFISNIPYYFTGGRPYAQNLGVSQRESDSAW